MKLSLFCLASLFIGVQSLDCAKVSYPENTLVNEDLSIETHSDLSHALSQAAGIPPLTKNKFVASTPSSRPDVSVTFIVDDVTMTGSGLRLSDSCPHPLTDDRASDILTVVSQSDSSAEKLVDQMVHYFKKPTVVVLAADKELSSILSPTLSSADKDVFLYTFDDLKDTFKSVGAKALPGLAVDRNSIVLGLDGVFSEMDNASYKDGILDYSFDGKSVTFNIDNKPDFALISEVFMVSKLTSLVGDENGRPHFFKFALSSLAKLGKIYGEDSSQKEAGSALISQLISSVETAAQAKYSNAVFSVLTLQQSAQPERREDVDADWGPNYHIYFNIFFWLTLGLIVITWLTIYANATIDPGYDSVIYRTTRRKND